MAKVMSTNDYTSMLLSIEDCYHKLGTLEKGIENYIDMSRLDDESQWFSYLGFDIQLLNRDIIKETVILQQIDKVAPIDRIVLLSMPTNTTYNWHIDDHRKATVNLLLNNHSTSSCLFGKRLDDSKHTIRKLQYEPNTFYLFNTRVEHMVINNGERRFMLSMQFDSKLNYGEIKEQLEK